MKPCHHSHANCPLQSLVFTSEPLRIWRPARSAGCFRLKVGLDALQTCKSICQHEIERARPVKGVVRSSDPSRSPIAVSEHASQCAMNAEQRCSPPFAVEKPLGCFILNAQRATKAAAARAMASISSSSY